ncbi:MAG: DUF2291 domain-containing protein [Pseudomonadota bacterium]|nr:DUF2291 domain-containing protein [Pseudomonadota bacterium]
MSMPPSLLRLRACTTRRLSALLWLAVTLSACRIEHVTPQAPTAPSAGADQVDNFENKSFDPKKQAADIWEGKVLPAIKARAGAFPELRAAMRSGIDAAGAAHGHRERGEGAPWNFATVIKGRIVEVDSGSSAASIGVDTDGDGKADARVQIGPVLRGTAIRDSLPFISFTSYSNQVEFAQLANAFNDQTYKAVLKGLPRASLKGRSVEVLGVFTASDDDDAPLVTPVALTLGPAS